MPKKKTAKYYRYESEHVGIKFFRVIEFEDVLQIISKQQKKTGRPYCPGITKIKYTTFISSSGWRLKESRFIKEITERQFQKEFDKMVKRLLR